MGGRGVIRLKYVHAFRDRTGRMRYYFRRHGIRRVLPGLPGSTEFMTAYGVFLADKPKEVERRPVAAPNPWPHWRSGTMDPRNIWRCRRRAAPTIAVSSMASLKSTAIGASIK